MRKLTASMLNDKTITQGLLVPDLLSMETSMPDTSLSSLESIPRQSWRRTPMKKAGFMSG